MNAILHFGIDVLLAQAMNTWQGLRVGLVTNDVATTAVLPRPLMPVRRALQLAGVQLSALFAPEHGLGAAADDGAVITDMRDSLTGVPVYSLYGATYRPPPALLTSLDRLLFDIPDIGTRFYTYIWTLSHVMEACAETGTPLWVLDRPNPLSGDLTKAEGPLLDEATTASFVGRWSIPIRHCLTVGELARLWNAERNLDVDLTVMPMNGWQRSQLWPVLGLPFVPTSPSLPSYETALIYPGTCLFEGTNLSEGRGTTTPFRAIGAPWLAAQAVADKLNQQGLPGAVARAVEFTPTASKYAGQLCQGVMLHVLDEQRFRPVATGMHLLATIIQAQPDHFQWLPYPTADSGAGYGHFDRLIGQLWVREALEQHPVRNETMTQWTDVGKWTTRVEPYLLYH